MEYRVTICGKPYALPPRTLEIEDQITAIADFKRAYQAGEITRREEVERMHAFVTGVAPGSLPTVNEVDINELAKACQDVIFAYDAPARKARNESKLAEAREMLSRPEIQKLIELAKLKQ